MEMITITFEIATAAIVQQSFKIPKNYLIEDASIEELYEEIQSKFSSDYGGDVLNGDIDITEFSVDNLEYNGFCSCSTHKNGELINVVF